MDPADFLALRQLVDTYAAAVDDRDGDGMARLFVPEGKLIVYEAGSSEPAFSYLSPAEIATVAAEMERLYVRTYHFVGNFTCTIDGDTATGEPYCVAYHLREDGRASQVILMPVRYRDSYLRTLDGWRFVERLCTIQWRERRPANQWPPRADS